MKGSPFIKTVIFLSIVLISFCTACDHDGENYTGSITFSVDNELFDPWYSEIDTVSYNLLTDEWQIKFDDNGSNDSQRGYISLDIEGMGKNIAPGIYNSRYYDDYISLCYYNHNELRLYESTDGTDFYFEVISWTDESALIHVYGYLNLYYILTGPSYKTCIFDGVINISFDY